MANLPVRTGGRFRALLTAQIRQFEAIFLKYRSGLLPESQWEGFGNAVEYSMRRPGSRQCWVEVRPVFSPEFRSFVDEAIVRVSES